MIDRVTMTLQPSLESLRESEISEYTFEGYKNKLKGRLFGVLCEREKGGEWQKFLDSITIELIGLGADAINWWSLIGKLQSLRFLSYEYFRKTIFECMNLVGSLEKPDD